MPFTKHTQVFHDLLSKDVEIPFGRFEYPCRFKVNPAANYLSVQLHGAHPRDGSTLPVFARWNWGKILGAHVLSICDPTIYLDETLRIGWYLGSQEECATKGVVAIAEECARVIGLPQNRIIYSGGSGGGFAALQAAALAKDGKALAINPQTNLSKYNQASVMNYLEKVTGCISLEEAEERFGSRWNAIRSLADLSMRNTNSRIVYVQNQNEWHFNAHFAPLAKSFGLDLHDEISVSGNFMSILYEGPHEHTAEPSEVVKRINNEAIPFLLDNIHLSFSTNISLEENKIVVDIVLKHYNHAIDSYQFACYLLKDAEVVEKRFYQARSRFLFDSTGAGQLHVSRICSRCKREEIVSILKNYRSLSESPPEKPGSSKIVYAQSG